MEFARAAGLQDEDVVAKQMTYFLGNNSFLGLQSVLKSVIGELSAQPKLRDALRDEIVAAFGAAPGDIDLRKLAGLPQLDRALREILRLHPPVFFLLARATRDRVIESNAGVFAVAKGELLIGVIPFAHLDDAVHADPERFDADRFVIPAGKTEAEASRHLIWPRGLHDGPVTDQNRTCPGKDVAILIAKLFCVALLPRYRWELAKPPRWGRHFFTLNVAAPVGAMRVKSFARTAAKTS
jgi:cytochrome P450